MMPKSSPGSATLTGTFTSPILLMRPISPTLGTLEDPGPGTIFTLSSTRTTPLVTFPMSMAVRCPGALRSTTVCTYWTLKMID